MEPEFKRHLNPYFEAYPEGDYWMNTKPCKSKVALLLIDMQRHFYDISIELKDSGNPYLNDRLDALVIPNSKKLLDLFRKQKLSVTYATIGCQKSDGSDRSPVESRPGWNNILIPIGSKSQKVIDILKPKKNEIVVYKTTDSALNGTNYGHILKWMGIDQVVVCGIFTDQCVAGTVRDLADWGYTVFLVEDATSSLNAEIQEWETKILNQVYCKVVSTDEVILSIG